MSEKDLRLILTRTRVWTIFFQCLLLNVEGRHFNGEPLLSALASNPRSLLSLISPTRTADKATSPPAQPSSDSPASITGSPDSQLHQAGCLLAVWPRVPCLRATQSPDSPLHAACSGLPLLFWSQASCTWGPLTSSPCIFTTHSSYSPRPCSVSSEQVFLFQSHSFLFK